MSMYLVLFIATVIFTTIIMSPKLVEEVVPIKRRTVSAIIVVCLAVMFFVPMFLDIWSLALLAGAMLIVILSNENIIPTGGVVDIITAPAYLLGLL